MSLFQNGYNNYSFGRQCGALGGLQMGGGIYGAQAWRRNPVDFRGVPAGGARKWAPPVETPFPVLQSVANMGALWLAPYAEGPLNTMPTKSAGPAIDRANFVYCPGPARPTIGQLYNGYRSANYERTTYDLATANLSGRWDYTGYSATAGVGGDEGLWLGVASGGASNGRDIAQTTVANVPVDAGGGVPQGDGVGTWLVTNEIASDFFTADAGIATFVFYLITAAAFVPGTLTAQTPYDNPPLFSDSVGYLGLHLSDAGLTAGAYDGVARDVGGGPNDGWQMVTVPCPDSQYVVGQMRWGKGRLEVRVFTPLNPNGGEWKWCAFGSVQNLTGNIRLFANYSLASFLNANIYNVLFANFYPSDIEADGMAWAAYAQIGQSM